MRARIIAFTILAAIIVVGPAYGHFFAEGDLRHLGWRMFRVTATRFCAVEYRDGPGEGARPIDRFAALVPRGRTPPTRLWRITDEKEARRIAADLCRALGRDADVRMTLQCASEDGWRERVTPEERLCRAR